MLKWLLVFIMLATLPFRAYGQWVKFEACGMDVDLQQMKDSRLPPYKQHQLTIAPTLGPYWVWVPGVYAVMGITEKERRDEIACTVVLVPGHRLMVVGTLEETVSKLKRAK